VNRRILVVEDEKIIQLDIRYQLEELGYVVAGVASSGEEAISKAAQLEPDLVLMDLRLKGGMDGFEAAQKIRSDRAVPVIYLTAQNIGNDGSQEPLQPCLPKPFKTSDLGAAITHALGQPFGLGPATDS
jgi:CheY-like chemotaxis protein